MIYGIALFDARGGGACQWGEGQLINELFNTQLNRIPVPLSFFVKTVFQMKNVVFQLNKSIRLSVVLWPGFHSKI